MGLGRFILAFITQALITTEIQAVQMEQAQN
jgi:hypothetical protein